MPDPKYKVGDKIVFRKDLIAGKVYGNVVLLTSMLQDIQFQSQPYAVVLRIDPYSIKGSVYGFSEEMIKGLYSEIAEQIESFGIDKKATKELRDWCKKELKKIT
jgi:hypothetical protein